MSKLVVNGKRLSGGISHGPIVVEVVFESNTDFDLKLISGRDYDCVISWGDGNETILNETGSDNLVTHNYNGGTYYLKINGKYEGLSFNTIFRGYTDYSVRKILSWGNPEVTKLKEIPLVQLNNLESLPNESGGLKYVESFNSIFYKCISLKHIPKGLTDYNNVATDMDEMFFDCTSLESVSIFDTSNITNMLRMFYNCTSLKTIPLLDTGNVLDMGGMFQNTNLKSIPLIDTSKVINMRLMFSGCTLLATIPLLDTGEVLNMMAMFSDCALLATIPLINTSKVTEMGEMFSACALLATIPLLDTGEVLRMKGMFSACALLATIPLIDTSKVNNMRGMFSACALLATIPLLDTGEVLSMEGMFYQCSNLESIPLIDTSKVNNMIGMFKFSNLTTIPLLDTSKVIHMGSMYYDCSNLIGCAPDYWNNAIPPETHNHVYINCPLLSNLVGGVNYTGTCSEGDIPVDWK